MNDPKYLSKIDSQNKIIDYDELIKEGVSLIQKFSGNKWTDYNYHDPGITFLEQICYALTDLGYRTSFKVEDILMINKDDFDLKNQNMLFPLNEILPTSPLTLNDFRKLIIERVEGVKNVWVEVIKDNSMGLNGLYSFYIQCEEDLSEEEILITKEKAHTLLMDNRTICTDYEHINILNQEQIEISAIITIDPFSLGESVLAEIYNKVDKLLNPEIILNDIDSIREKGYDETEIFSGIDSKYGFIDPKQLVHKTSSIYQGEIKETINSIDGVIEIVEFKIFKDGVEVYDDLISFNENSYPSLKKTIIDYNEVNEKIIFLRNDSEYGIDSIILSQLYDSLIIDSKSSYNKELKKSFLENISGRFQKSEIESYYSIQNELPSIYGLRKDELPKNSNPKRKSQSKQLKAFLYFFEQIMANYLSQLANIRSFFSVDIEKSYFGQIPNDIPDLDKIIKNRNLEVFEKELNEIEDNSSLINKKKHQVIDHLLARFNESYDVKILSKLIDLYDENPDLRKLLDAKVKYAKHILELGKNINKGFNYLQPVKNNENISGLEKRLKLILDINSVNTNKLSQVILKEIKSSNSKNKWSKKTIKINGGINIDVNSVPVSNYNSKDVFFFTENEEDFKSLMIYGKKRRSYKVIELNNKSRKTFNILFNSPTSSIPSKIFESNSKDLCDSIINDSIKKFSKLNLNSQGFHIIEHILLRPSQVTKYNNVITNKEGELLLESFVKSDFENQKDIRSDIYTNTRLKENFTLNKATGSSKFNVIVNDLFGNPVLISKKKFNTENQSNIFINQLWEFFKNSRINGLDIKEISKIEIDSNPQNEFPSNFRYSNQISIICPNWPDRFQNKEFISYLKLNIEKYIPLHVDFDLFFLNLNEMSFFEKTYFRWVKEKLNNNVKVNKLSVQLIQLINSYNKL